MAYIFAIGKKKGKLLVKMKGSLIDQIALLAAINKQLVNSVAAECGANAEEARELIAYFEERSNDERVN